MTTIWKKIWFLIFIAVIASKAVFSQYLSNPSFEGVPQPNIPPPDWQICITATSTPDVQPGNFDVYLPPSGYMLMDHIRIKPTPIFDLGNDTLICSDGEYIIHAGSGYYQYHWQDGTTDSLLTIDEPGTYWVTVTSIFGYSATDSINIELFPALPLDLGNDTIVCEGALIILFAGEGYISYLWHNGETSQFFPSGWDGKQNGKYVAEGSYFWILDAYYGNDNIKRTFKGSLTVSGKNN